MLHETQREKAIHKVFVWGILLKAFDGVVEILGGLALLFPRTLVHVTATLIHDELVEDPHDFVATHLQHVLPSFLAQSGWFAAIYLISHGIIKIVLVAGLLRDKVWAYPTAIGVFTLFIMYQIYRYAFTHSIFLILLTVLDVVVIWLTWHEYRYFRKYREFAK
jgi:uncharacterized membrane protein